MTEGMSLSQLNRPTINMDNTGVANNPNDKASGEEYFDRRGQKREDNEFKESSFVDRTAELRATLNSLAALNAASVVKAKDKYKNNKENKLDIEDNSQKIQKIMEEKEKNNQEKKEEEKKESEK